VFGFSLEARNCRGVVRAAERNARLKAFPFRVGVQVADEVGRSAFFAAKGYVVRDGEFGVTDMAAFAVAFGKAAEGFFYLEAQAEERVRYPVDRVVSPCREEGVDSFNAFDCVGFEYVFEESFTYNSMHVGESDHNQFFCHTVSPFPWPSFRGWLFVLASPVCRLFPYNEVLLRRYFPYRGIRGG